MNNQNLMIGLVTDTDDPDKNGRIRIKLPALPDGPIVWARVVLPLAGKDSGLCLLPEVGDEVLVAFSQADLSSAYVLGGLWGKQKQPPEGLGTDENAVKMLRTRSGHTLSFCDTKDGERIVLTDKNENALIIDTAQDSMSITAKKKLSIQTDGDLEIKGKTIKIQADTVEMKADSSLAIDGGSKADINAGTININ